MAFEIYYPEPLSDDIIRKSVGGVEENVYNTDTYTFQNDSMPHAPITIGTNDYPDKVTQSMQVTEDAFDIGESKEHLE